MSKEEIYADFQTLVLVAFFKIKQAVFKVESL